MNSIGRTVVNSVLSAQFYSLLTLQHIYHMHLKGKKPKTENLLSSPIPASASVLPIAIKGTSLHLVTQDILQSHLHSVLPLSLTSKSLTRPINFPLKYLCCICPLHSISISTIWAQASIFSHLTYCNSLLDDLVV